MPGMLEPWTQDLTLAMLPKGKCRVIAAQIGISSLLELAAVVGGQTFYLPKQDRLLLQLRNQRICEEFNGQNAAELARKYHVNQRWIYQIVERAGTGDVPPNIQAGFSMAEREDKIE